MGHKSEKLIKQTGGDYLIDVHLYREMSLGLMLSIGKDIEGEVFTKRFLSLSFFFKFSIESTVVISYLNFPQKLKYIFLNY